MPSYKNKRGWSGPFEANKWESDLEQYMRNC